MKNIDKRHIACWVLMVISVIGSNCYGQVVKHHNYTTYFNQATHEPDSVSWILTPDMINCRTHLARTNKFTADPLIKNTNLDADYAGSGYDRGHQFPAQDASCNTADETECFYFSNMVLQKPNLNRITWKNLEVYTRKIAAKQVVYVTCGITGDLGTIGKNKIVIPAVCWKRLRYGNTVEYYVMPNVDSVKLHPYAYYKLK